MIKFHAINGREYVVEISAADSAGASQHARGGAAKQEGVERAGAMCDARRDLVFSGPKANDAYSE